MLSLKMVAEIDEASVPREEQVGFVKLEYANSRIYPFYLLIQIASVIFCLIVDTNPPYSLPIPQ